MTATMLFTANNIKYQNLNQGIFNDTFYFGKIIHTLKKPTEIVILSNKQHFTNYYKVDKNDPTWNNEILDNGFYYRQAPLDISPTWSNESINNFVSDKSEIINKIELYDSIRNKLQKYMDVTDDRILDLVTTYIIGTYCYSLFKSYGYLFFNSDRESGKTKFMNLIEAMSFNPINATNPSESALFRICELNSPTLLVDDYEGQDEEKQKTLNQILKVGYKKGGQVIRTERDANKNFEIRCFDVYSPKIISNTTLLDEILLTRCIVIRLLKTTTNKGRLEPDPSNPEWQEIKNNCYLFVMQNWKKILETYKQYNSEKFNNRHLEIVKGVLSIAKFINQETHDQIELYLENSFFDRDTEDLSTNWDYLLLKTMYDNCSDNKTWNAVSVVSVWFRDILPEDNRPKHISNWVGKKLSRIPLFQKRRVGAGVEYLINRDLIEKYMASKGFPLESKQDTQITHKYKDDDIKELNQEILDTCYECNDRKYVKFTSTITPGRNYCKECVVRVKNKELLDKIY